MLELGCYQLPTLDTIYSKVFSLVSLTLPPCALYLCKLYLLCFSFTSCLPLPSHLLHFQFTWLMLWPLTSYIRLLILYDMLMLKYWLWFSFHCLLNLILAPLNLEPLFSNIYVPRVMVQDKKCWLHKQSEFSLGSHMYSLVIILHTISILYSFLSHMTKWGLMCLKGSWSMAWGLWAARMWGPVMTPP